MSYNKFKTETLNELLGIDVLFHPVIPKQLPESIPSAMLLAILDEANNEALGTEKAKSEHIILPVIKELKRKNPNTFSYFSGYQFDVDKKLALNGFCDFILSAVPNSPVIKSPIFCLVEAKNGDINQGLGQCGAEMYAAHLFNERHDTPAPIYGCITNAFSWCFLKLEQKMLFVDTHPIALSLEKPEAVLAALQWVLMQCLSKR